MAGAGHTAPGFAVRRGAQHGRGPGFRRAVVAVVLLVVLGAGFCWLDRVGTFSIARVETGTYRFTDAEALEFRLEEFLGRRLWQVRQSEVAAALADLPWIRAVVVRRHLPATLQLELTEWRPLLAVAGPEPVAQPRVLLGDGRVEPFPAHLPAPALPVLVGAVTERDSLGTARLDPAGQAAVVELIAALEASGLETACPVDFVVARDGGYAIVLEEGEGTLLVGREDFTERLERYLVARDHLEKGLEVDLRFGDRVTVRRSGS